MRKKQREIEGLLQELEITCAKRGCSSKSNKLDSLQPLHPRKLKAKAHTKKGEQMIEK